MYRQAAFRQHRSQKHAKSRTTEDSSTPTPLPIESINQEPTIRQPVRVQEEQKSTPPDLLDADSTSTTPEKLQERLNSANSEIKRLKEIIARSTNDGVSINIPIPPINAAGLTSDTYEAVKVFYSGIVLEMIKTTYAELERRNRQAYGFYVINGEKKEIDITIAITKETVVPSVETVVPSVETNTKIDDVVLVE